MAIWGRIEAIDQRPLLARRARPVANSLMVELGVVRIASCLSTLSTHVRVGKISLRSTFVESICTTKKIESLAFTSF